jgi:hypothetical protein
MDRTGNILFEHSAQNRGGLLKIELHLLNASAKKAAEFYAAARQNATQCRPLCQSCTKTCAFRPAASTLRTRAERKRDESAMAIRTAFLRRRPSIKIKMLNVVDAFLPLQAVAKALRLTFGA